MLMLGAILLILSIVAAIYAFGMVGSPYVGTARIVFYFVLVFFLATVVVGIVQQSYYGGYDPTTTVR